MFQQRPRLQALRRAAACALMPKTLNLKSSRGARASQLKAKSVHRKAVQASDVTAAQPRVS